VATDECFLCPKPVAQRHHLTGRDPTGAYLDPQLTVGLCASHHVLVHEDLRSQRLDTPPVGSVWSPARALAFRIDRLATFLGRYAERSDQPLWEPLAEALRDWSEPESAASDPTPWRQREHPDHP